MKTYLITGGAGFIGSTLAQRLLNEKQKVIIVDNFCDYYDPQLKQANVEEFRLNDNFQLYQEDIRNHDAIDKIFAQHHIDFVVHLAAMAGVRPSIENPSLYQSVNGDGTQNILEAVKKYKIRNLIMASSSSVYGNCSVTPFKEDMVVDEAISPYAATKKSNEVMAHVYHHLYDINVIALRFFTVYGPKQRPDLAIHKFTELMLKHKEIPMFGNGTTARDYTFIDDIIDGITKACSYSAHHNNVYEIINLGNRNPISLKKVIHILAKSLGVTPKIQKLPMQPGDVNITCADITKAKKLLNYQPKVSFEKGIQQFIQWYEKKGVSK